MMLMLWHATCILFYYLVVFFNVNYWTVALITLSQHQHYFPSGY